MLLFSGIKHVYHFGLTLPMAMHLLIPHKGYPTKSSSVARISHQFRFERIFQQKPRSVVKKVSTEKKRYCYCRNSKALCLPFKSHNSCLCKQTRSHSVLVLEQAYILQNLSFIKLNNFKFELTSSYFNTTICTICFQSRGQSLMASL